MENSIYRFKWKIKIVKDEVMPNRVWDYSNSNNWDNPVDLNTYLNESYLKTIIINQDKIEPCTWSIGAVTPDTNSLIKQIADENRTQSQIASVGLITASEYLRANSNTESCENYSLNNKHYNICKDTNWLVKENSYWTISARTGDSHSIFFVESSCNLYTNYAFNDIYGVLPAVNLSSDINLSGTGKLSDPFIIVE